MSSTSWTPDEDFSILFEALQLYDAAAQAACGPPTASPARFPRLLVVVTGAGPLRARYEAAAAACRLPYVAIRTAWLAAEDYPRLLSAADLGISLHASSCGLDLPMKARRARRNPALRRLPLTALALPLQVVDMFGASLPVAALEFAAVRELVSPSVNGVLFADAAGLAARLAELLEGFGGDAAGDDGTPALAALRAGARDWAAVRWQDAWAAHAAPLFDDA